MGWLSPNNPYTGDGRTSRNIYDTPKNTFRTADDKKLKSPPPAAVKPKKK